MSRAVAIVTPSHRGDLERFALLCESIDRFVTGYERHYVIVNDDDMASFASFDDGRRVVLPSSLFLPFWIRPLPAFVSRNGRRTWWSFRSAPLHGWHIQQILKISGVLKLPHQRYCMVDSDNVFFRPLDIAAYAGGDRIPLYVDRRAIRAEAPLHAVWVRNCDRLLGTGDTAFPADDFIGNLIVWDQSTLRKLTSRIEATTRRSWVASLCRTRAFSEYLLYGYFVRQSQEHQAVHCVTTSSPTVSYWEGDPLDGESIAAMVRNAPASTAALCIESFSATPVALIRKAVGL